MASARLFTLAATIALAGTTFASPSQAQDTQEQAEGSTGEIIVEGYTEKEVRQFLWRSLVETEERIATRMDPVCLKLDNIEEVVAIPVAQRIESNLLQAGVEVDMPGCDVNALVVFHRDAPGLVRRLSQKVPLLFRTMYKPEVRRLIREERPVYSWMYIGTEFRQLVSSLSELIPLAPSFDPALSSRIPQERELEPLPGINRSYTIVDTDEIDGMTTVQLADFLTLQIMIEFQPGQLDGLPADSILNLFYVDNPDIDAPSQMSVFDRQMLTQTYGDRRNIRTASAVRHGIASAMIDRLDAEGLITD